MASVAIHPPKTPVTKGSMGIAKATIPNICKMDIQKRVYAGKNSLGVHGFSVYKFVLNVLFHLAEFGMRFSS